MNSYCCYPFMKREFGSVKAESSSIRYTELWDSFSHRPMSRLTHCAMYPVATRGQPPPVHRKWGCRPGTQKNSRLSLTSQGAGSESVPCAQ